MTVANTTFQSTGTGDGATTAFTFNWRIVEDASVAVYVSGVKKTLGADYSVVTNRLTTGIGGTVTFTAAPANAAPIVIQRESDQLQSDNLQNNQAMPPSTVMKMVDKLCTLLQDALRKFISADTTIAASSTYTLPHGLGKIPDRIQLALVCQITDGGYAVGDVISVDQLSNNTAGGAFFTTMRDITNVVVRTSTPTVLNVVSKTNTLTTISPYANWKLRVYAK